MLPPVRYLQLHTQKKPRLYSIYCSSHSVATTYGTCNGILYISTLHSMCAVPSIVFICSPLILRFSGTLHRYIPSDFDMAPVNPIVTGITFVCTFHMCCISIARFYILESSQLLSWSHHHHHHHHKLIWNFKFIPAYYLSGGGFLVSSDLNRRSKWFTPTIYEWCHHYYYYYTTTTRYHLYACYLQLYTRNKPGLWGI